MRSLTGILRQIYLALETLITEKGSRGRVADSSWFVGMDCFALLCFPYDEKGVPEKALC